MIAKDVEISKLSKITWKNKRIIIHAMLDFLYFFSKNIEDDAMLPKLNSLPFPLFLLL